MQQRWRDNMLIYRPAVDDDSPAEAQKRSAEGASGSPATPPHPEQEYALKWHPPACMWPATAVRPTVVWE